MRILTVHNKYLFRGGEDESRESEDRILKARGHEVEEYVEDNNALDTITALEAGIRTVWSRESHRNLLARIGSFEPDVINVQNFFPLISPAVYYAARTCKVPVVQTLHNFRLLCPSATFFRDGRICEDCIGRMIPWPSVVHGCYRGSRPASAVVATMVGTHRALGTWNEMVDVYVALTEHGRRKFIQGGLPAEKIVVKANFVEGDVVIGGGQGGYALFVGRLSSEKGLGTLLKAWEKVGPAIPLKIVGDGPNSEDVEIAVAANPAVEWLGRLPLNEVYSLIGEATVLLCPSEWYETFGRVVVEAFAKGTPVIASDLGAMSELVAHGRTGLLHKAGNPEELASSVNEVVAMPAERMQAMRRAARSEFEAKYTEDIAVKRLLEIFMNAVESSRSRYA